MHTTSALLYLLSNIHFKVNRYLTYKFTDGWFDFHDLWQLTWLCIVGTTLHWAASDRVEDDGGRLGWQRQEQGMTGEDLGWQWVFRGWQREAREDRGLVQGMIGAEKWHKGYVQGVARDGGIEVQGMTGMERDFHWDSGFWNQYCSLTVHITEHFILVCMSVFFLFFFHFIFLSFICLSVYPC